MTDRAPQLAEFLAGAVGMSIEEMNAEVLRRWPDLTLDEFDRAVAMAIEITKATAAEHEAEADALQAMKGGQP